MRSDKIVYVLNEGFAEIHVTAESKVSFWEVDEWEKVHTTDITETRLGEILVEATGLHE